MGKVLRRVALGVVVCLLSAGARAATPGGYEATIAGFRDSHNTVLLTLQPGQAAKPFAVPDTASRQTLLTAQPGDVVELEVNDVAAPTAITGVDKVVAEVAFWPRLLTFAIAALVALAIAVAATKGRPQNLVLGVDGRMSNSQTQLVLWFGAVAIVYVSAVWLRFEWLGGDFIGGVGLTSNIIALTGLSAFSFGGAKAISAQKAAKVGAMMPAPRIAGQPPTPTTAGRVGWSLYDLVQSDDGQADIGDLQMILITLAAVAIFVFSAFHFLGRLQLSTPVTLPDVDTALLASFGIGQGAYLAKKAAMPYGKG